MAWLRDRLGAGAWQVFGAHGMKKDYTRYMQNKEEGAVTYKVRGRAALDKIAVDPGSASPA